MRPSRLAIAISFVWARWSTTSATDHPGQREAACHPASSRPATRSVSSTCWSSSAATTLSMPSR